VTSTTLFLFLSSCAVAIFHGLIPDHWLPFVLMSRSQGWADRSAAALAGLAGLIHVLISTAVGAMVIVLGADPARGLAARTGQTLEFLAGLLLIVFGLVYGIVAHLREARVHAAGAPAASEGHVHVHGHLLERWFRRALTGGALVLIIGVSPCALMVPLLFAASTEGPAAVVAAAAGFGVCTVLTMMLVTLLATRGMRRLALPFFTRYGDLISGLLIAALGLYVILRET
jgi:nickel/cobalt transporter (NicO) family protein